MAGTAEKWGRIRRAGFGWEIEPPRREGRQVAGFIDAWVARGLDRKIDDRKIGFCEGGDLGLSVAVRVG